MGLQRCAGRADCIGPNPAGRILPGQQLERHQGAVLAIWIFQCLDQRFDRGRADFAESFSQGAPDGRSSSSRWEMRYAAARFGWVETNAAGAALRTMGCSSPARIPPDQMPVSSLHSPKAFTAWTRTAGLVSAAISCRILLAWGWPFNRTRASAACVATWPGQVASSRSMWVTTARA